MTTPDQKRIEQVTAALLDRRFEAAGENRVRDLVTGYEYRRADPEYVAAIWNGYSKETQALIVISLNLAEHRIS